MRDAFLNQNNQGIDLHNVKISFNPSTKPPTRISIRGIPDETKHQSVRNALSSTKCGKLKHISKLYYRWTTFYNGYIAAFIEISTNLNFHNLLPSMGQVARHFFHRICTIQHVWTAAFRSTQQGTAKTKLDFANVMRKVICNPIVHINKPKTQRISLKPSSIKQWKLNRIQQTQRQTNQSVITKKKKKHT